MLRADKASNAATPDGAADSLKTATASLPRRVEGGHTTSWQYPYEAYAGMLIAVSIVVGLINPRTFSFSAPVCIGLLLALFVVRRPGSSALPGFHWGTYSLGVFFAYAFVSAAWSLDPALAASKAVAAATLCAACGAAMVAVSRSSIPNLAYALTGGLCIGLLCMCWEIWSNQSVLIFTVNALGLKHTQLQPMSYFTWHDTKLVAAHNSTLNRNMVAIALLVWPANLAILTYQSLPRRKWIVGAVFVVAAATIFGSQSETSKLALFAGGITLGLASTAPNWAWRSVAAAWVFACTMVVPLALLAHAAGHHKTTVLATASAGARISIAHEYAMHVLEAPLLGHGLNQSYVVGPKLDGQRKVEGVASPDGWMAQHPHNAYMQVWYDLGVIGIVLFMVAGLAVLRRIWDSDDRAKPFVLATFAAWATAIAPSYGLWQYWFMTLFGMTALATAIATQWSASSDS